MKLSDILFKFDNISKFVTPQEFWCHICDQNLVKTEDPASGVWFQATGHIRKDKLGSVKDDTGDYECVIFAVCKDCYGDFKYE